MIRLLYYPWNHLWMILFHVCMDGFDERMASRQAYDRMTYPAFHGELIVAVKRSIIVVIVGLSFKILRKKESHEPWPGPFYLVDRDPNRPPGRDCRLCEAVRPSNPQSHPE